jgi:nicotinamide-nucleotide amidase
MPPISSIPNQLARQVVEQLRNRAFSIVPVESCTGGAFSNALTHVSGSSDVFSDGFITYSNDAKKRLGVSAETIQKHTIYSLETALEMAKTGLKRAAHGDLGVGITGSLTRSDPANPNSVPGQAYIAVVLGNRVLSKKLEFDDGGSREESKAKIVEEALKLVLEILEPL